MAMQHTPVKSSAISSVGYDEDKKLIEVKFKNGKTYGYENQTRNDFEALRDAESVGKHFNENFLGKGI